MMLKLKNVSVKYGNIVILKNISFELNYGENLSIIGANGSGKTTLLNAISKIIPFEGEILFKNLPIKNIKPKIFSKEIALLSQITKINFNYTVFEVVIMGRYPYTQNRFFSNYSKYDIEEVEKALTIAKIYDIKDKGIENISGGQLQRVFLAKIICQNPSVILLDEPTNHLDFNYQIEFINFLKSWTKKENKILISVLHDINLSILLSDKLMLMKNGEIIAFGNTEKILKNNEIDNLYNTNIKDFMINMLKKWESI